MAYKLNNLNFRLFSDNLRHQKYSSFQCYKSKGVFLTCTIKIIFLRFLCHFQSLIFKSSVTIETVRYFKRKQDWKVFQPHRLHNKWPWPLWPLCSKSETRRQDYKTTRQQQLRQKNMGLWCCAADTQPKNYILKNG